MKLKLIRTFLGETYTIGKLYVDDVYFCDTLEDKYRDLSVESKVYGQTAIPYGKYNVIMTLSNRFKRVLPLLLNVEHFEGIRMHRGNTDADSSGCILVGINKVKGKVLSSTMYEKKLCDILSKANKITIEICKH